MRYLYDIVDPYVLNAGAISHDFILMHDTAHPHRVAATEDYIGGHGLERMDWSTHSLDQKSIEHLWNYLGKHVAALCPLLRSIHELEQG